MRQPLSKHGIIVGLMMQTSSSKKVYGLTQQTMHHARAAFQDVACITGRDYAHTLVMQMLRDTYELRKQSQ